jgi:hypothetical protein
MNSSRLDKEADTMRNYLEGPGLTRPKKGTRAAGRVHGSYHRSRQKVEAGMVLA